MDSQLLATLNSAKWAPYASQIWGPGSAQSDVQQTSINGQTYYKTPNGVMSTGGSGGRVTTAQASGNPIGTYDYQAPTPGFSQQSPGGMSPSMTKQGSYWDSDPFPDLSSYHPGRDDFMSRWGPLAVGVGGPLIGMAGAAAGLGGVSAGGAGTGAGTYGGMALGGGSGTVGSSVPLAGGGLAGGTAGTSAGVGAGVGTGAGTFGATGAGSAGIGAGASSGMGAGGAGFEGVGSGGLFAEMPGAQAAASGATGGIAGGNGISLGGIFQSLLPTTNQGWAQAGLGGADFLARLWQQNELNNIASESSDRSNALAQPQRRDYQDLLKQYYMGNQDITQQPIVKGELDYMNRLSQAQLAKQGMSGSGNAPAFAINYANEALNRTAQPYLNNLGNMAGFNQGPGYSGNLYGQYSSQATAAPFYGLTDLMRGMTQQPNNMNAQASYNQAQGNVTNPVTNSSYWKQA